MENDSLVFGKRLTYHWQPSFYKQDNHSLADVVKYLTAFATHLFGKSLQRFGI